MGNPNSSQAAPADLYDRVEEAAAFLREHLQISTIDLVCVLGSGLGPAINSVENPISVPTTEVPHFPPSTVEGHSGTLHHGLLSGKKALVLQGRVHTYEGVPAWESTIGIRVAKLLGAHTAVLTNSAGGLNPAFSPGDLMVLNDHINLSGRNPLFGPHDNRLGPRFPDITDAYDPELRAVALNTAKEIGLPLHEGVYTWMLGPSYESPAEIRMLKTLGADAVGMSTVPETIVARQMGMRVLAFSCISNLAAGISPTPLTHEEVQEVSGGASERFSKLILQALKNLS